MKKIITMLVLCVLVALLPFQATAESPYTTDKWILPFFEKTWDDMDAMYASGVTFKQETVYVSSYKCLLNLNLMSGNAFSAVLKPDNSYSPVNVWQRIGTLVMPYFDEMNQVTPSAGNLAAYEFNSEETYMRIEYMPMSYGSDCIIIICIKNEVEEETGY